MNDIKTERLLDELKWAQANLIRARNELRELNAKLRVVRQQLELEAFRRLCATLEGVNV